VALDHAAHLHLALDHQQAGVEQQLHVAIQAGRRAAQALGDLGHGARARHQRVDEVLAHGVGQQAQFLRPDEPFGRDRRRGGAVGGDSAHR